MHTIETLHPSPAGSDYHLHYNNDHHPAWRHSDHHGDSGAHNQDHDHDPKESKNDESSQQHPRHSHRDSHEHHKHA